MGGDLRSMAVEAEIDGEIDDRPIRSEHLGREPIRSEHLLSSDVSCRQPPANAGKHTRTLNAMRSRADCEGMDS